jgi:CheY-like chemotaxis protein
MTRIIVVDDQASQRDGRVSWLSTEPGVEAEGMTFEQAVALGAGWQDVDIAVLDAHDRRSQERRDQAAAEAGIEPIAPHDRYVGVRVAELIRLHSRTRIILISAVARDSDLRARRIAQAGIDYVFEHYEVDQDARTFVQAVCSPETFSLVASYPAAWSDYTSAPNIRGAIASIEESPAGRAILLQNKRLEDNKSLTWSWRKLRDALQKQLSYKLRHDTGRYTPQAPRKDWLLKQLDEAFGQDLPVDPAP